MYLFTAKIIFACIIFFLTLITGFIPLKIAKHNTGFLGLCDAFASGIFLSAALLHLLPDAVMKFGLFFNSQYPLPFLICIATYALLLTMERVISIYTSAHHPNNKIIIPFFLISLLTIHSLVEGAAIGINTNLVEACAIFFAVFAHKGSESFALTINLHCFGFAAKKIQKIIAGFSLMTPLGIFIASSIISASATSSGEIIAAITDAATAGTFLYLGTGHLVDGRKSFAKASELGALIFGITMMATIATLVY